MNLTNSLKFSNINESKRILFGQRTVSIYSKFIFLSFPLSFIVFTFFIGLFFLNKKKKQFHPDIFIEGSKNYINKLDCENLLKSINMNFQINEQPLILINTYKDHFILYTSQNVYFKLYESSISEDKYNVVYGKLPIVEAGSVKIKTKLRETMFINCDATIMFNNKIIGRLDHGSDKRIMGLLREAAKDINNHFS